MYFIVWFWKKQKNQERTTPISKYDMLANKKAKKQKSKNFRNIPPPPKSYYKTHPPKVDVFYSMVLEKSASFILGVVYSCFNEGKFGKIAPPLVNMTYLLG